MEKENKPKKRLPHKQEILSENIASADDLENVELSRSSGKDHSIEYTDTDEDEDEGLGDGNIGRNSPDLLQK